MLTLLHFRLRKCTNIASGSLSLYIDSSGPATLPDCYRRIVRILKCFDYRFEKRTIIFNSHIGIIDCTREFRRIFQIVVVCSCWLVISVKCASSRGAMHYGEATSAERTSRLPRFPNFHRDALRTRTRRVRDDLFCINLRNETMPTEYTIGSDIVTNCVRP